MVVEYEQVLNGIVLQSCLGFIYTSIDEREGIYEKKVFFSWMESDKFIFRVIEEKRDILIFF